MSVMKGAVPDLHERGRLREVEARKLGAAEGVGADRRELGGDHDSAPELSVIDRRAGGPGAHRCSAP